MAMHVCMHYCTCVHNLDKMLISCLSGIAYDARTTICAHQEFIIGEGEYQTAGLCVKAHIFGAHHQQYREFQAHDFLHTDIVAI